MEMFFDIMSHRPELFAGFLESVTGCNILRSKCLQSRHLLGVLRNRYHRVIPLLESLGDLLSVRPQAVVLVLDQRERVTRG